MDNLQHWFLNIHDERSSDRLHCTKKRKMRERSKISASQTASGCCSSLTCFFFLLLMLSGNSTRQDRWERSERVAMGIVREEQKGENWRPLEGLWGHRREGEWSGAKMRQERRMGQGLFVFSWCTLYLHLLKSIWNLWSLPIHGEGLRAE